MKVSRYWVRISALAKNHIGDEFQLVAWSSSNINNDDASMRANAKMKKWIERLSNGEKLLDQYPYELDDSIREELVEEISDANNQLIAAITRNNYGALVLNASNVMFVDVDLPDIHKPSTGISSLISKMFGRKKVAVKTENELRAEYLQKFSNFQKQHSGMAFRVYGTARGFRLLMLHKTFDPIDPASQEILETLESDPLYRNLCKSQQCYRARLTPKPWRCGFKSPPNRFPRETQSDQAKFESWLSGYEQRSKQYAVCELVAESGDYNMPDEVRLVLELHDRYVLDDVSKALA